MRRLKKLVPRVPRDLAVLLLVAFSIFLMAGGVYMLVDKPPFALSSGGRIRPVMPRTGQTVYEGVVSAMLYGAVFSGLLLCYRASVAYNPRVARMLLTVGVLLSILSLAGLYYMIWLK